MTDHGGRNGTTIPTNLPEARDASAEPVKRAACEQTVLVVEDDDDVRRGVTDLLSGGGYRVLTASNGHDAIAILGSAQPIDLVFSDIVMPQGINGVDVANAAVRLRKDIRILLTSGYAEAALVAQGITSRFLIFLKPYHPRELVETVRGMLGSE